MNDRWSKALARGSRARRGAALVASALWAGFRAGRAARLAGASPLAAFRNVAVDRLLDGGRKMAALEQPMGPEMLTGSQRLALSQWMALPFWEPCARGEPLRAFSTQAQAELSREEGMAKTASRAAAKAWLWSALAKATGSRRALERRFLWIQASREAGEKWFDANKARLAAQSRRARLREAIEAWWKEGAGEAPNFSQRGRLEELAQSIDFAAWPDQGQAAGEGKELVSRILFELDEKIKWRPGQDLSYRELAKAWAMARAWKLCRDALGQKALAGVPWRWLALMEQAAQELTGGWRERKAPWVELPSWAQLAISALAMARDGVPALASSPVAEGARSRLLAKFESEQLAMEAALAEPIVAEPGKSQAGPEEVSLAPRRRVARL